MRSGFFLESHAAGPCAIETSGTNKLSSGSVQEEEDDLMHTEIPKKKLLELMKVSMDAQYANTQVNIFTSIIAGKVKEFYEEGKVNKI